MSSRLPLTTLEGYDLPSLMPEEEAKYPYLSSLVKPSEDEIEKYAPEGKVKQTVSEELEYWNKIANELAATQAKMGLYQKAQATAEQYRQAAEQQQQRQYQQALLMHEKQKALYEHWAAQKAEQIEKTPKTYTLPKEPEYDWLDWTIKPQAPSLPELSSWTSTQIAPINQSTQPPPPPKHEVEVDTFENKRFIQLGG